MDHLHRSLFIELYDICNDLTYIFFFFQNMRGYTLVLTCYKNATFRFELVDRLNDRESHRFPELLVVQNAK